MILPYRLLAGRCREVLGAARQLTLPSACVSCGLPGAWCCSACFAAIPPGPPPRRHPVPVVAGAHYDGTARQLMLALKDRQITAVSRPLAAVLGRVLTGAALVPVPAHRRSWLERGFDPLSEILRHVSVPVHPALGWRRQPRTQKSLSAAERRRNVTGAFRVRGRPMGPVAVIDDVITTGATTAEAVRVLRQAGWEVLGVVGVCLVADPQEHPGAGRVSVKPEPRRGHDRRDRRPWSPHGTVGQLP
ncbi:MAG: hypothetical protein U0R64_04665 [Candidatus Nanopelagicales bacterium]